MANPLLFLLFFPLFLFLSAPAHAKVCPACGSTAVPYPLSTANGCGDPLYKIRCNNTTGSLFFDALNGSSYTITSITPTTQRLVIRPAAFVSSSSCVTTDLRTQGIQLNSSLPFNVSSSNTIMLLNCTSRLLLSPLNCSSSSPCHTYVNATPDAASCRAIPICCTFVAGGSSTSYSVRASGTGCSAYRSFVNLDMTSRRCRSGGSARGWSCSGRRPWSPCAGPRPTAKTGPTPPAVRIPRPVQGSDAASATPDCGGIPSAAHAPTVSSPYHHSWNDSSNYCDCPFT